MSTSETAVCRVFWEKMLGEESAVIEKDDVLGVSFRHSVACLGKDDPVPHR